MRRSLRREALLLIAAIVAAWWLVDRAQSWAFTLRTQFEAAEARVDWATR